MVPSNRTVTGPAIKRYEDPALLLLQKPFYIQFTVLYVIVISPRGWYTII